MLPKLHSNASVMQACTFQTDALTFPCSFLFILNMGCK